MEQRKCPRPGMRGLALLLEDRLPLSKFGPLAPTFSSV